MKKKSDFWLLIIASIIVSILSHAFFIGQWFHGTYMIGPNDGLSQMVPFREMLYDHFSQGNFFYSYEYGLGGGTFSQLAYYYATNLVFWIVCMIVFLLETVTIIQEPNVLFWAKTTLFISIFRLSGVLLVTTIAFKYIRIPTAPAFTGAVIYGASIMYFRHNAYWEFFSDAFLWLPILFLGIEKVMREGKPGWLIVAVAISAFDNFYFAFIHCLFAAMYIGLRWLIRSQEKEVPIWGQLKLFITGTALGAGIGAFSFVPAVYGFLNNFRPSYEDSIPLFDFEDEILFDDYRFLLPVIFLLFAFVFRLYQNRVFRVFAFCSFLIIVMHYMPIMWSVFNGFSAPQGRFQYLGSFAVGGTVASGLSMWHLIKWRDILFSSAFTILVYIFFYNHNEHYDFSDLKQSIIPIGALFIIIIWIALIREKSNQGMWLLCVAVIAVNTAVMYQFQEEKIYQAGNVEETTKDYILSNDYYSKEQRDLIHSVLEEDEQPLARMEWKTDGRNNTPIIQGFTGTSVYSSVLNQNLLFFYYHDLEIDMKRESVSRYAGFGDRANLHSLFTGKYVMQEAQDEDPVPYGFVSHAKSENYIVYRNTNPLPFVRASSHVYGEKDLKEVEILSREQAMLQGIVIEEPDEKTEPPPENRTLTNQIDIKEVGSEYTDGLLIVEEETGGLDLQIENPREDGDYYVSFFLNQAEGMTKGFPLHVNGFRTTRKPADSIYRTKVNQLTIRVEAAETISIRVPEGSYRLENLEVFYEDYQKLKKAAAEAEANSTVEINGNRISIVYDNKLENKYLTIPIPYEKGWQVHVNGEKQKVEKANFAFLGTTLELGENKIEFVYYPPYFKLTLFLSFLSFFVAISWINIRKRNKSN